MKDKEEKKTEKPEESRFSYSSDDGLRVLTEEDILNSIKEKDSKPEETIKKGHEQWL